MKLNEINESERDRAKLDKDGNVLCLHCEKNLAKISEYGMLRKCDECENKSHAPMVRTMEHGKMKIY